MSIVAPFGKMDVAIVLLLLSAALGGIGGAPIEAPEICLLQAGSVECSPDAAFHKDPMTENRFFHVLKPH